MLHSITQNTYAREHIVTITRKGQITIPASLRKHLKTTTHRKLALVVDANGSVQLKTPKYPTLESTFGAVKPLAKSPTLEELREAIADEIAERHAPKQQ